MVDVLTKLAEEVFYFKHIFDSHRNIFTSDFDLYS